MVEDKSDEQSFGFEDWINQIHNLFNNSPIFLLIHLEVINNERKIDIIGMAPDLESLRFTLQVSAPPDYVG